MKKKKLIFRFQNMIKKALSMFKYYKDEMKELRRKKQHKLQKYFYKNIQFSYAIFYKKLTKFQI